jgi:WD repeat-containing protein mio
MYQVHDTPKQALWSARGEFGMGSGTGFKFIPGYQDDDPFEDMPSDRQPSAIPTPYSQFERGSRSRSAARRDDSSRRGRTSKNDANVPPGSALFARDEDPHPPSGVATQLAKNVGDTRNTRAYSPASFRKYAKSSERGDPPLKDYLNPDNNASRSRERTKSPPRGKHRDDPLLTARPAGNSERLQSPAPSKRKHSTVRHVKQRGVNHVVEEDISMVMRKRALKGYCLSKVWALTYFGMFPAKLTFFQPFDNSTIAHEDDDAARNHDDSLSEVWAWIHRELSLCS